MKKAYLLVVICSITGLGAFAAIETPAGLALRYVTATEASSLVKQQLGPDAFVAVSSVDEERNVIALNAAHAQAPVVRAFLLGLDNPPRAVRSDATVTQKSADATKGSRPAWEYRVLGGYTQQLNAPNGAPLLDPLLKSAGEDGWEAVSWAQAGDGPPFYRVLLKRAKQ